MKRENVNRAKELIGMIEFIDLCLKEPLKVSLNYKGINGITNIEDITPFLKTKKKDMEEELKELGVDP